MEEIQPIVLVGGRSTRFGRDKLREPVGGGWMVDRPIAALRAVFGSIVASVGACDPGVAARADRVIEDHHPGAGPIGGIVSALEVCPAVFVCAGDMPGVTPDGVRVVLAHASRHPEAWAVLARTDRLEPCFGLYRPSALAALAARLGSGSGRLHDALPAERVAAVDIASTLVANVNAPGDLPPTE
ncbi:MAG: molybdenum cofactor guanylyltransferase [Phycisphaerae bacterium]|nr:molybdenum cofactor guanylyltransferase [Phycisphaerae bacterium]